MDTINNSSNISSHVSQSNNVIHVHVDEKVIFNGDRTAGHLMLLLSFLGGGGGRIWSLSGQIDH